MSSVADCGWFRRDEIELKRLVVLELCGVDGEGLSRSALS